MVSRWCDVPPAWVQIQGHDYAFETSKATCGTCRLIGKTLRKLILLSLSFSLSSDNKVFVGCRYTMGLRITATLATRTPSAWLTYRTGERTTCRVAGVRACDLVVTCSDCMLHFSYWCDMYKEAKVVHGNQSDNHCNQSDTQPSVLLPELY